jgi:hypothetical protein
MFIGIVSLNDHIVEKVNVDVENEDVATSTMAAYVYHNYNKNLSSHLYYQGVVIDTENLKTIGHLDDNIT